MAVLSVLRSQQLFGRLPWSDASINGWVLDPDRKKMSKSKGEVVTPLGLVDQHGADAIRYWAAAARPGADTTLDANQFRRGGGRPSRCSTSRGSSSASPCRRRRDGHRAGGPPSWPVWPPWWRRRPPPSRATTTPGPSMPEAAFWRFCDDYVELVKGRAYDDAGNPATAASAVTTLRRSLDVLLRLLAPFLPFATEEAWSWWHDGSIHRERWPQLAADGADPPPRSRHRRALVGAAGQDPGPAVAAGAGRPGGRRRRPARLERLAQARADVVAAGHIAELELVPERPSGGGQPGGGLGSAQPSRRSTGCAGSRSRCPPGRAPP